MSVILGIDLGTGAVKAVKLFTATGEYETVKVDESYKKVRDVKALLEHICEKNGILYKDVKKIAATGVGSAGCPKDFHDIPVILTDEFKADAVGGAYKTGLENFILVSMGTGTSIIKWKDGKYTHLGGIGLGGGTFLGLSKLMLGTDNVEEIIQMSEKGDIDKIDLLIKDISPEPLPGLPFYATASSFGKVTDFADKNDVACGIVNLILQTIGETAVLASRESGINDFILIGGLALLPQCKKILSMLERMFSIKFFVPGDPENRTALGAALCAL